MSVPHGTGAGWELGLPLCPPPQPDSGWSVAASGQPQYQLRENPVSRWAQSHLSPVESMQDEGYGIGSIFFNFIKSSSIQSSLVMCILFVFTTWAGRLIVGVVSPISSAYVNQEIRINRFFSQDFFYLLKLHFIFSAISFVKNYLTQVAVKLMANRGGWSSVICSYLLPGPAGEKTISAAFRGLL